MIKDTRKTAPTLKKKSIDDAENVKNAALIGGSSMASNEPFGPVIGAAMGAAEEGLAILTSKSDKKKG